MNLLWLYAYLKNREDEDIYSFFGDILMAESKPHPWLEKHPVIETTILVIIGLIIGGAPIVFGFLLYWAACNL